MRTVDALPQHVPAILARMAPNDLNLLQELTNDRGSHRLVNCIERSSITWCGVDDAGPVNVGGVWPHQIGGCGYVWQVITPDVALHKRDYLLQGRQMLGVALNEYRKLVTVISADYAAALRHMRRLKWNVADPVNMNGTMACLCERGQ